MPLLTFRIRNMLGAATEKLPKQALAKNEPWVSRSSLLIVCFHKVRVNKTLQGQHGETFYKTPSSSPRHCAEFLIMNKYYLGDARWKHTRGSQSFSKTTWTQFPSMWRFLPGSILFIKAYLGCQVPSCQIIVCVAVDFRLFLSYKRDRKTQRNFNLFTRTQRKGWVADRLLAYFINIPWEYSAHRCVSKEQQ